MPKKKTKARKPKHDHKLEPSWTGPDVAPQLQGRVQRWLSSADTKAGALRADLDFTQNINWRIFRIMAEFIEGFEFLSKLKKSVTVFGSARASASSRYYQMAKRLGVLCAKSGYAIVTGGGPGVMEAANWGAADVGGDSVGLDISLPMEQRRNQYVKRGMGFHYFFTRKVMLSASAQAYVFFPGGFGTLDELFEMVALIQTGKMSDAVPVILVGRAYWEPMLAWIRTTMSEEYRFVERDDIKILQVVDSAEEAFAIIKKTPERVL